MPRSRKPPKRIAPQFTLGDRLRKARELSQYANDAKGVAEVMGVSPATITNWETGRTAPQVEFTQTIRELAGLYGVDELWLFTGQASPDAEPVSGNKFQKVRRGRTGRLTVEKMITAGGEPNHLTMVNGEGGITGPPDDVRSFATSLVA